MRIQLPFPKLNIPEFDLKIKEDLGKFYIFDIIRKSYILLTPEEWVRQHFIHFLINQYKYPATLFKIESGLKYNQLSKRSDILVYDRTGKPFLLIECKSYEVKLGNKDFQQVSTYNKTIQAPYIAISNGLSTFCASIDFINQTSTSIGNLPPFE